MPCAIGPSLSLDILSSFEFSSGSVLLPFLLIRLSLLPYQSNNGSDAGHLPPFGPGDNSMQREHVVSISCFLRIYLSVCPSVSRSIRPSVRPSVLPSVYLSIRPSVRQSARLFICSSVTDFASEPVS